MQMLNPLFSIAALIALGYLARRLDILSLEHTKGLSSFVYYFALPALFFAKISTMNLWNTNQHFLTVVVPLLPIALIVSSLMILYIINIIKKDTLVMLCLSIVFGSHVFFGIAFFELTFGKPGLDFAVLTSSFLGPIGVISTVVLFEFATNESRYHKLLFRLFSNPLIIAISLGCFFSLTNITIDILFESLLMLGRTAGPLSIFLLGMFIYNSFTFEAIKKSFFISLFRLTTLPIVTYFIVFFIANESDTKHFFLLQSGIPLAVSVAVYAQRYNYKPDVINGMVICTSIGSFPVLYVIFYLFL